MRALSGTARPMTACPGLPLRSPAVNGTVPASLASETRPVSRLIHDQRLSADIKDHKINVVVVYKVDRLTRSLADFAKLVELFDAHGVSFVSVTQQFNTTTSMGRLTLNVLLSFAQFEREVTAERIRDKIAASKRKGLWVGGTLPLGYELKDGKLLIVKEEAKQVRTIFRRYLELGSVNRLVIDLHERNFRSKIRKLSDGRTRGGVSFTQGPLFYMLRNRFYIGEVCYKNAIYPGPQPPLMDRDLFDAVQEKLTAQWSHRTTTRNSSPALLRGLLFDESGHPMRSTHATKNGVRYRYYVSQPYLRGITTPPPGAIVRVPAAEIESVVASALKAHLHSVPGPAGTDNVAEQNMIASFVSRVEIHKNELAVWLKVSLPDTANLDPACVETNATPLLIRWCKPPFRRAREILLPASVSRTAVRPIKAERRASLLKSIARGRQWLDEIVSGAMQDVESDRAAPPPQRSLRQHDDLDGVYCTKSGPGCRGRSSASRHRCRQLARCASRMVASICAAR